MACWRRATEWIAARRRPRPDDLSFSRVFQRQPSAWLTKSPSCFWSTRRRSSNGPRRSRQRCRSACRWTRSKSTSTGSMRSVESPETTHPQTLRRKRGKRLDRRPLCRRRQPLVRGLPTRSRPRQQTRPGERMPQPGRLPQRPGRVLPSKYRWQASDRRLRPCPSRLLQVRPSRRESQGGGIFAAFGRPALPDPSRGPAAVQKFAFVPVFTGPTMWKWLWSI